MPEKMQQGYGYPDITPEVKRLMLGGTQARIAGLDVAGMAAQSRGDEFDLRNDLAAPWARAR